MKWTLLSLIILASCASDRSKTKPSFDKDVTCSKRGLEYYNRNKSGTTETDPKLIKMMNEKMTSVSIGLKSCYEVEANKHVDELAVNVCFIAGVSAGKIDFLDFSTSEKNLSKDFYKCAEEKFKALTFPFIKKRRVILQPYNFYPAP